MTPRADTLAILARFPGPVTLYRSRKELAIGDYEAKYRLIYRT
jgi:hypothetical protein